MHVMGAEQNIDLMRRIASALDWWHDAGVEQLVGEVPHDWLAAPRADAPLRAGAESVDRAPAIPAAPVLAPMPDDFQAFAAWRVGAEAPEAGWPGPRLGIQGVPGAAIMIIADMPDREDEADGVVLSGRTGMLFDRMLAAIGLARADVLIAPLVTARPPGGRVAPDLAGQLETVMRHLIGLAAPKRLLLLGNAASRALTGLDVSAARGNLHVVNHKCGTSEAVACFHPRFLVERPAAKAEAWRDLQLLMRGL